MQATTIKIEDPILKELRKFVPPDQSLSAFVREILERDIQRRKMVKAAQEYASWLENHPDEREWLDEWDDAHLERPPASSGAGKNL